MTDYTYAICLMVVIIGLIGAIMKHAGKEAKKTELLTQKGNEMEKKTHVIPTEIETQLIATKLALRPDAGIYDGCKAICDLIEIFYHYLEGKVMDKKMHAVTKQIKTAEKDIKKGEPKKAAKVLKKAEAKNEKLVKIDREVRDPLVKECKKDMKKGKKK